MQWANKKQLTVSIIVDEIGGSIPMPYKVDYCLIGIKRDGIFNGVRGGTKCNTARRVVDQVESNDGWRFAKIGLNPAGRELCQYILESSRTKHHSRI